jgi:hypothetical protein
MKKYKRIPDDVNAESTDNGFSFNFNHTFNVPDSTATTYFAYTFPYSYAEVQKQCDDLEIKYKDSDSVYFKRELLAYSHEKRRVDLMTLTSYDKIQEYHEEILEEPLFPQLTRGEDQIQRPKKFNKPYVFLTARVHSGEIPC